MWAGRVERGHTGVGDARRVQGRLWARGGVGRRHARQDEIGTPVCLTVDFESLEDQAVPIRDRDAMTQERVGLDAVQRYLHERLGPL